MNPVEDNRGRFVCTVAECGEKHLLVGLCDRHFWRWCRGSPGIGPEEPVFTPLWDWLYAMTETQLVATMRALRTKAEQLAEESNPLAIVYFVADKKSKSIKIGWTSKSMLSRLRGLQTAAPNRLRCVGIIRCANRGKESELHRQFAHLRLEGEWFKAEPDLVAYIAKYTTPSAVKMVPRPKNRRTKRKPIGIGEFCRSMVISKYGMRERCGRLNPCLRHPKAVVSP